jgi:hypothetical protein
MTEWGLRREARARARTVRGFELRKTRERVWKRMEVGRIPARRVLRSWKADRASCSSLDQAVCYSLVVAAWLRDQVRL